MCSFNWRHSCSALRWSIEIKAFLDMKVVKPQNRNQWLKRLQEEALPSVYHVHICDGEFQWFLLVVSCNHGTFHTRKDTSWFLNEQPPPIPHDMPVPIGLATFYIQLQQKCTSLWIFSNTVWSQLLVFLPCSLNTTHFLYISLTKNREYKKLLISCWSI